MSERPKQESPRNRHGRHYDKRKRRQQHKDSDPDRTRSDEKIKDVAVFERLRTRRKLSSKLASNSGNASNESTPPPDVGDRASAAPVDSSNNRIVSRPHEGSPTGTDDAATPRPSGEDGTTGRRRTTVDGGAQSRPPEERTAGDGRSKSDDEAEDVETVELSKLRCPSEAAEVVAERELRRRRRRCSDYPGLAFGTSLFSSDTMMKFSIIKNELHNILNSQLKRVSCFFHGDYFESPSRSFSPAAGLNLLCSMISNIAINNNLKLALSECTLTSLVGGSVSVVIQPNPLCPI